MISVIIPFYNTDIDNLKRALDSLSKQDCDKDLIETVICNDGDSPNKIFSIMNDFQNLNIVYTEHKSNMGISAARNSAFQFSSGKYLILLDADDQLVESAIRKCLKAIKSSDDISLVFSNAIKYNSNMKYVLKTINSHPYACLLDTYKNTDYNPLFHSVFILQCICFKRDAFEKVNGFDESIRCGELTDFVIKINNLTKKKNMTHVNDYLYLYRDNPYGLSKNQTIHVNRKKAFKKGLSFCTNINVDKIDLLGRLNPYGMLHYNLFNERGLIKLPYVNYQNLSIEEDYVYDKQI